MKRFQTDGKWAWFLALRTMVLALALPPLTVAVASAKEQPVYSINQDTVFAKVNGDTYEISGQELAELPPIKSIILTADLDSDGHLDAVISLDTGGNCCPSDFAVVTYRGDGFFAVATHPEFSAWFDPKLVTSPLGPLLLIRFAPDGVQNTSLEEYELLFRLQNGQLRLVSKLKNEAMLFSPNALTSKALVESGKELMTLVANMDGDAQLDKLTCEYWDRWGALTCTVGSSVFGVVKVNSGCDRMGILDSKTNGLRDLVCGRSDRLVFDGEGYRVVE